MSPLTIVRTLLLSRQPPIRTTPLPTVPSLGSEMVTNGNMELDANWNNQGAPTTNERSSVQAHGGTYSRHVVAAGSNQGILQSINTTVGQWIKATGWLWVVSGTVDFRGDSNVYVQNISTTGSWQSSLRIWRATATSHNCLATSNGAAEFYADDFSWKAITLASSLAGAVDVGSRNGVFSCTPTAANDQCGMVLALDNLANPQNYVHAYVDRNNGKCYLLKVIGGVTTELIAANFTYVAAAQLSVIVRGQTYQLFYNGVQLGADQTITDVGFGTWIIGFDPTGANSVGTLSWTP